MDRPALVVTVVPPLAIGAILYATAGPPWNEIRVSGLILVLLGLVFLTIARFQLGNSFSVTPQARMLVTRGLYSRIRHPVYIFGTMTIAGLFLYLRRPLLLLLLLVLIPMQVLRARQEQRVLEARFGEEYRQYRRSTWF